MKQLMQIFLKTSTPEQTGPIVKVSKKSETNLHAVHVGLLVLLKQWVIEFVSNLAKLFKQEYQLKIYWAVAVSHVVWDAMEVSQVEHGDILRIKDLFLVIFLEIKIGADLTLLHLAIITPPVNMNHVEHQNLLLNAQSLVILSQKENTKLIKFWAKTLILSHLKNKPLWMIFLTTDLLKELSLFMKISYLIKLEFINMLQDQN